MAQHFRLVKYYNLPRYLLYFVIMPMMAPMLVSVFFLKQYKQYTDFCNVSCYAISFMKQLW